MRGADDQPRAMFSYVSLEERVPPDHPLRAIRRITDRALEQLSPRFGSLYINFGRPSIPPERLLRALLLQALYTIRSERQLMEQLDDNLLFRWFVGLGTDDPVWTPTTFTKNRDRLLTGDIAAAFFDAVLIHAETARLLSDEHFTSMARCSRRGPVRRVSARATRSRRRRAAAIPRWISMATNGPMRRISRRPIPTPGCTRKPPARRRGSGIWATSCSSTAPGSSSTRASRRPMATGNAMPRC